jgi:transcriptional regulator with XRE-family HTH domain
MTATENRQAALLRDARNALRMTQRHLAEAAAVSVRTVMRAEGGKDISDENARSLCAVLGMDVGTLRTGGPNTPVSEDNAVSEGGDEPLPREGDDNAGARQRNSWQALQDRLRGALSGWRTFLVPCRVGALMTAFILGAVCVGVVDHMKVSAQPGAYHLSRDVSAWAEETVVRALQNYEVDGSTDRLVLEGDFSPGARDAYKAVIEYEQREAAKHGEVLDGFSNLTGSDLISQQIVDGRYTWKVRTWFYLWQKNGIGTVAKKDESLDVTITQGDTVLHQLAVTDIQPR